VIVRGKNVDCSYILFCRNLFSRGRWLGEKYDGIRCWWDPTEKQLYSRHGSPIDMLSSMFQFFGGSALDAELWYVLFYYHYL
jgi:hypothetical protein